MPERFHPTLLALATLAACRPAVSNTASEDTRSPSATPAATPPRVEPAVASAAEVPASPCTIVELEGEGRDRDSVGRTLASQGEPLRECYAQLHERRPAAAGVARIQLVIDPNGLAGLAGC